MFNINCDTSICTNTFGAQTQAGVATVANTASLIGDTENSAEVEQEAEMFNINCDTSICTNLLGVKLKWVLPQLLTPLVYLTMLKIAPKSNKVQNNQTNVRFLLVLMLPCFKHR